MKTSNKIFSFGFLISILFAVGSLLFVKSNLVPNEQYQATKEGKFISETRTIGEFDKLKSSSLRIELHYGEPALKVDADENLMDRIITEVKDGELYIGLKPGSYNNIHNDVRIHLTTKNLKRIKARGGANIFSDDSFTFDKINFEANGGGHIKLEIQATDVNVEAGGGGGVILFGNTTNLTADINGGGWLEAFESTIKNANMKVGGGGRAEVNAEALTRAKVSGGGTLIYKGNPTINDLDISGGGRIF